MTARSIAATASRLTVEPDEARNGKHLWGEQYHRKLADLLAAQSNIAKEGFLLTEKFSYFILLISYGTA